MDEELDFAKVTVVTVSSTLRCVTVQVAAMGDAGDDNTAERGDDVEVLQPLGLMASPTLTAETEAPFVRIGDRQVALGLVDKSAPVQNVATGETRLYGVNGSTNNTATIIILPTGAITITPKSAQTLTLAGGAQPFIKGTVYADAEGVCLDALKVLFLAIGTFATAVGAGTPLFPAVAAAAVVLNTAIGVANTAIDTFKASRSAYLSTIITGT